MSLAAWSSRLLALPPLARSWVILAYVVVMNGYPGVGGRISANALDSSRKNRFGPPCCQPWDMAAASSVAGMLCVSVANLARYLGLSENCMYCWAPAWSPQLLEMPHS